VVALYVVAAASLVSAGFFLAGYVLGVYITERAS